MADVTTLSTFRHTVFGNKRVVYADVPAAQTTADSITMPLTRIEFASATIRSTAAGTSLNPVLSVSTGGTILIYNVSTAAAYTIEAVGI